MFTSKLSSISEILPNIEFPKYNVFNEIENSWNITKQKYGNYLWPISDIHHHELYFHLIKNACDNKKMIIRNPMYLEYNQSEIISSDIYFITHFSSDNDKDLICNYYFKNENIVMGIFLGTGLTDLGVTVSHIIYLDQQQILLFYGPISDRVLPYSKYFLPIINNVINNELSDDNYEKINNTPPLITTIAGYNQGLFHTCCTFVTGIYIMDKIGINNDIDEIIIGLEDPFLIEKYYKNKYKNIIVTKGINIREYNNNIVRKGILFKYNHFHVTKNCAEFIKSYINEVMPICEKYKNEIEYIKHNFYPIFSVNLRCLTCEIKDQSIVISETINKLKQIYPNSFFLIGGFLGDYNEDLLNINNMSIAPRTGPYYEILNEYENTFQNIKNSLNHFDIKSLINLKINNVLEFTKIVNFSINMNAGYTCVETILHNIPSTYFGTRWNDHNRRVFYISKENYTEPIFVEEPDIKFLTYDNGSNNCGLYDSRIISEINSDTIVNIVLNYYKQNNNFITNRNITDKKHKISYIAHRGNLNGPDKKNENNPTYLLEAISKGFCVETDLWVLDYDKLYLGHDLPQYEIDIDFLLKIKEHLYCHCKNIKALHFIINNYPEIECFFHDADKCVLTSKNHIWNQVGEELTPLSICVMPEKSNQLPFNCFGICSDYPLKYSITQMTRNNCVD